MSILVSLSFSVFPFAITPLLIEFLRLLESISNLVLGFFLSWICGHCLGLFGIVLTEDERLITLLCACVCVFRSYSVIGWPVVLYVNIPRECYNCRPC